MHSLRAVLLSAGILALALGCSHKKVRGGEFRMTQKGVITVWADWVKPKKSRYDMHLNLTNENSQGIIVMLGEMHCFRGATEGILKHTFFNTGERTIDFAPTQTKSFNALCDFQGSEVADGDYRITINNVYANPSGDGATKGKVLAHGLELRIPETDKPAAK